MAQILALPTVKASAQPVGHFLRLGDTGHRQLADLHAEGRFSPKRVPDMLSSPKRHSVYQRMHQIQALEVVPDLNRAQHFLDGEMAQADRLARQIKELKTGDAKLDKRMLEHSRRMEKLRSTLEHFHSVRGAEAPRALPLIENKKPSMQRGVR